MNTKKLIEFLEERVLFHNKNFKEAKKIKNKIDVCIALTAQIESCEILDWVKKNEK